METLNLTTPTTPPTISGYRVSALILDWDGARIVVELRGTNNEVKTHVYTNTTATNLMIALNKANLSTMSLHKRVLQQLAADGVLTGSVSGSPD